MLAPETILQAATDPQAFTKLYECFDRRVYQYMRYRVNADATAEDLTAQVFERVLLHLPRYQPSAAPFEAWLFRIAANSFTDWYRQQRRRPWLPWGALQRQPAAEALPEEQLLRRENHSELQAGLRTLTPREREIIALRFGAALTNREIAALCELSEQNTAVILYRALKKLKVYLQTLDAEVKYA